MSGWPGLDAQVYRGSIDQWFNYLLWCAAVGTDMEGKHKSAVAGNCREDMN